MGESLDWQKATEETVSNLSRLIQAETVNPPGNELQAILIVRDILEASGFTQDAFTIVESAPNRPNLIARIRGDGSQKPLLLSGHVDVAPVERERWSHDPFGGEVINGEVWGRGAVDMKGFLAMYLEIFLSIYRQKIPLKRDVILAAIADEEHGFTHGSKFLVEQYPGLIDAEYGITEGGAVTIWLGKIKWYPIQVAEKSACRLHARVHGKVGHGSVSQLEGPIFQLALAIENLRKAGHLPVHLTTTFQKMLDDFGAQLNFPFNILIKLFHSPKIMHMILNRMKGHNRDLIAGMVTNTPFLNMLQAGSLENPTPSMAEVDLSCRLLPGQTPDAVIYELHQIMGEEIEIEVVRTFSGTEFSTETPFYKLLEKRTHQMDPEGLVTPTLFPGGTDASQYQNAGITVYGFTPGILPPGLQPMVLAHGHDERIPISFIKTGLPVLWDVVTEFCGKG